LFNALSDAGAESANYPFCTIDPNLGIVSVPDQRLDTIAVLAGSVKRVPSTVEFVDIAGLVAGASKGEGLGNQFLGHIREVDALIHVVRCFTDENVVHVSGSIDPESDIEVVETELMLKDLESLEKRIERTTKTARGGDKKMKEELAFYERLRDHIGAGKAVRSMKVQDHEEEWLDSLFMLSVKPVLYAANVGEDDLQEGNDYVEVVRRIAEKEAAEVVIVSAELEAQMAELPEEDREGFLEDMGIQRSGLERLILAAYKLLKLETFFTAGPKETRAWSISVGTKAPAAAGTIHSDFQRGFIRAETIKFNDFVRYEGEVGARGAGAMRSEGKEYTVMDGDVLLFRFNV